MVSYLIDGLVLVAFHFAGTIGWGPVLGYTGAGMLLSVIVYSLIASGWMTCGISVTCTVSVP